MSPWTDDRCNRLCAMFADGMTFGQIATEMKITRNAAIGKALRLGLHREKKPVGNPRPKPRHRPQKRVQWKPSVRPAELPVAVKSAAAEPLAPLNGGVALIDLRSEHCRFPYGDGPFMFCGRPAGDGQSYCAHHRRIAYQSSTRAPDRYAWGMGRGAR